MTEPQEPRSTTPNHLTSDELSECAFSPQTAPAGWLEHAQGCAECAAVLADLRLLLAELAALPEPELPESVAIRLDAAVARAWQQADDEQEAAAAAKASAGARRGARGFRRKIAVSAGSLALIALVVLGAGSLLRSSAGSSPSAAGPHAATARSSGSISQGPLAQWVQGVLTSASADTQKKAATMGPDERCGNTPPRADYTILTTSQREFAGEPATLVVYQNAQEPSSHTVYAVVYEGSCPSSTSPILAQGSVSR